MTDADPSTTILAIYRQALALKLLPRTGWLQRGVAPAESVAAHIFGVAALALLAGDAIGSLDRGRLLAMALLHDLAEAALGDLPASATRAFGQAAKHAAERRALAALLAGHPARDAYLALWEEYEAGASPEARLVKGLDRIELLAQALAYEQAGSRTLDKFWDGAADNWGEEFPLLRALAERLVRAREND
jgi:putative hydrolase of HD superfamily